MDIQTPNSNETITADSNETITADSNKTIMNTRTLTSKIRNWFSTVEEKLHIQKQFLKSVPNEMNFSPYPESAEVELGIGWRAGLALAISRRSDLSFVEIVAENYLKRDLPESLIELKEKGVSVMTHCISLAPCGYERPNKEQIKRINKLAKSLNSEFVSDHISFVRANHEYSGHLLPVKRTRESLKVTIENVKYIKQFLDTNFALENIATICDWENSEINEADFYAEVLEQTDSFMILDVSNLLANSINHGIDPAEYLKRLPLDRLAYVHIAGGTMKGKFYHDTHAHPVQAEVLNLLKFLHTLTPARRVMLERDDKFPDEAELNHELDQIIANSRLADGKLSDSHLSNNHGHLANTDGYITDVHLTLKPESSNSKEAESSTETGLRSERSKMKNEQALLLNFLLAKADSLPEGVDYDKAVEASAALIRKRKRLELK